MSLYTYLNFAKDAALKEGKSKIAGIIKELLEMDLRHGTSHLTKKIRVTYTDDKWQVFMCSEDFVQSKLRNIVELAGSRISTISVIDCPVECKNCYNFSNPYCDYRHDVKLAEALGFCKDWELVIG